MPDIFICTPKRTPIGSLGGTLSSVSATDLGRHAVSAVLEESKLDRSKVDGIIFGCVLTAGLGQAPARQVAICSGLPKSTQALTVNKVCSSGLKAVMLAANDITLGHANIVIAGGMENMSQSPYLMPSNRFGAKLGHVICEDSVVKDGLWDVYNNFHMGSAAELCAKKYSLSRATQDAFALESYTRAQTATKDGSFAAEIVPVTLKAGKKEVVISADEEPGKLQADKIPVLKPVFEEGGTVTAANASSINDGAAAMIVASADAVKANGLTPIARIVAQGWNAQEPEWFTTAPVGAVKDVLKRAGKQVSDIDLFEINEAFSAVALACMKDLEIDAKKLNIYGGAVALGHPIGASGARILTTLTYALKRTKGKLGITAICNGGGEATALLVESV